MLRFGTGFGVVEKIVGKGSVFSPLNQLNGFYGYVLYDTLILCGTVSLRIRIILIDSNFDDKGRATT